MRKTALILAGALAFDLGVVAVAAVAQQQTREPPRGPASGPAGGPGPAPAEPAQIRTNKPFFEKDDIFGRPHGGDLMACVPDGSGECRPPPIDPSTPSGPVDPQASTRAPASSAGHLKLDSVDEAPSALASGDIYIKLDRVNTIRACLARRGEVVSHEGVQQCRLPGAGGAAIGNPTRNLPGGIPPRN